MGQHRMGMEPPPGAAPRRVPSEETAESFVIFLYGMARQRLLNGVRGAGQPVHTRQFTKQIQHISTADMFSFSGLSCITHLPPLTRRVRHDRRRAPRLS